MTITRTAVKPYIEIQPMLDALPSTKVAPEWAWRTAHEGLIRPHVMRSSHLFYTFRMIWNNTMPPEVHVGHNINYYRFGGAYTKRYLAEAIVNIGTELFKRTDLDPWMRDELDEIARHFAKYKIGVTHHLDYTK